MTLLTTSTGTLTAPMHHRAPGAGRDVLFRVAQRDTRLASVRYRALMPACALQDSRYSTEVCSRKTPAGADPRVAIAVKPLQAVDADWVNRMRQRRVPTVVDICDNIFVDGYGGDPAIADTFRRTIEGGLVTVPTDALKRVLLEHAGLASDSVKVVPDIVESPLLLRRQRQMLDAPPAVKSLNAIGDRMLGWRQAGARMLRMGGPVLLWFGNHGASYSRFGLDDLVMWEDALRVASASGAQLWVVSNHRERFEGMRKSLPIHTRYFEWSPDRVDALLRVADVCLIPNSMDAFSRSKSANRALKALAAGVPVVATPTPAMQELMGSVWLDQPTSGIDTYLGNAQMRDMHLARARALIDDKYSMAALRAAMTDVVEGAIAHG